MPHAERDELTAASVPCAAEEQTARGEMFAECAESSKALQSTHNTGLGRCLFLFLKEKLEKRDMTAASAIRPQGEGPCFTVL